MPVNEVHLLVIDPQEDFCNPNGALFVTGADEDMKRLSNCVKRNMSKWDDIHVTMDSHRNVDIAHPIFWKDSSGNHPSPFTLISVDDVEQGRWVPCVPSLTKYCLDYVRTLRDNNRYVLCIWPPHCLIGGPGHMIVPELWEVLCDWEKSQFATVDYVTKGSNIYTEHYSAVKAEVPDPKDPTTQINTRLITTLQDDKVATVAIAGEAGSHCLANTVTDIADNFGDDKYVQKLVLLTDATSPVTMFEKQQEDFINALTARGMKLETTKSFLA